MTHTEMPEQWVEVSPEIRTKTVVFDFEQKGFNAHTAHGEFTYDTTENAMAAAERLEKTDGYSNVRLTPAPKPL